MSTIDMIFLRLFWPNADDIITNGAEGEKTEQIHPEISIAFEEQHAARRMRSIHNCE